MAWQIADWMPFSVDLSGHVISAVAYQTAVPHHVANHRRHPFPLHRKTRTIALADLAEAVAGSPAAPILRVAPAQFVPPNHRQLDGVW